MMIQPSVARLPFARPSISRQDILRYSDGQPASDQVVFGQALAPQDIQFGKKNDAGGHLPLRRTRGFFAGLGLLAAVAGGVLWPVNANAQVKTVEASVNNVTVPVVKTTIENGKRDVASLVGEQVPKDQQVFAEDNKIPEYAKGQAGFAFLASMQKLGLDSLKLKQTPNDIPQIDDKNFHYQFTRTVTEEVQDYKDFPTEDCTIGVHVDLPVVGNHCVGISTVGTQRLPAGSHVVQHVVPGPGTSSVSEIWGQLQPNQRQRLNELAQQFVDAHSSEDYDNLFSQTLGVLLQPDPDLHQPYVSNPADMQKIEADVKQVALDIQDANSWILTGKTMAGVGGAMFAILIGLALYADRRRTAGGGTPKEGGLSTEPKDPPDSTTLSSASEEAKAAHEPDSGEAV